MRISAEELSQPISDDLPCGEDLEYDPAFQQIETLLQDQGDQVVDDDSGKPSGPDWKDIAEQVEDLNGRTRDMRVLVYGASAALNLDGIPAFHQMLVALNNCMENFWESIHPQLDEEDGFDPMMRMNVLQNLTDFDNIRQGLRKCPLVELRGVGSFSMRDIEIAQGKEEVEEGEDVVDSAIIQGAFRDADEAVLAELSDAIQGTLDELQRCLDIWAEKTDNWEAPGLDATIATVKEVAGAVASMAPQSGLIGAEGEANAQGGGSTSGGGGVPGAINSRSDVSMALDRICDYYAVHEPSSPIPFLLKRAKGLVAKDFMEILNDIAPDGMDNARVVTGQKEDEDY